MQQNSLSTNEALVKRLLATVDAGLTKGKGQPAPGSMCVEAAVCYAQGLPHSDKPVCVGAAVRAFKIALNDADWSSEQARAKGMRRIAVAQLGSDKIDQVQFCRIVALETIKQILPGILRKAGLDTEAKACEEAEDLAEAERAVARAARAALAALTVDTAALAARAAARAVAEAALAARAALAALTVDTAALAANAAARAVAEAAEATDSNFILELSASICEKALFECKSEGCEFLYLC